MSTRGNKGGVNRPVEFVYLAVDGQSLFTGADINGIPMSFRASPGLVDVYLNGGKLVPGQDYTLIGSTQVLLKRAASAAMTLVVKALFPYNAVDGLTVAASDAAYGRRRNRFIDPGMRVSQENGNNLLTLTNGGVFYASDSVWAFRAGATGGAQVQRLALMTPGGSPYRVRLTVTAANAAPATGDQLSLNTLIEGIDVADLRFGTLAPRIVTIRFGCRVSVAGTYAVTVLNGAQNRAWAGTVTVAQGEVGQDVIKSVTLLGDQTGTWAIDNTRGMQIGIGLCAGSSVQGVAGWQGSGIAAPAGCTNLMATAGATFDLFDIGLYDVTGLTPGVIPTFELGDYQADRLKCQRYYARTYADGITNGAVNQYNGAVGGMGVAAYTPFTWDFPVDMRTTPSLTLYSAYNGTAGMCSYAGSNGDYSAGVTLSNPKRMTYANPGGNLGNGAVLWAHAVANARL